MYKNDRKTVLIVDDDQSLLELLASFLSKSDMQILISNNAERALTLFRQNKVDLVVLDVDLGSDHGGKLCRSIQRIKNVPIIMLSAINNDEAKLLCFQYGADDYVTKPFNQHVLLARMHAILRRAPDLKMQYINYEFSGWRLNTKQGELFDPANQSVRLTSNLYALLLTFLEHPQQILSREWLLLMTQNRMQDPFERTIDIQLCRLRKKLKDNGKAPSLIQTIHGKGYQFTASVNYS